MAAERQRWRAAALAGCRRARGWQTTMRRKCARIRPIIRDHYGLVTLWEGQPFGYPRWRGYQLVDLGSAHIPPGAYAPDYECTAGG